MAAGATEDALLPINAERLAARLAEMAEIGATPRGGVNRQALTPEDGVARARLAGWARSRGFGVAVDPIGNLFVRRSGTDDAAPPVLTGSHLDTQPTGGRFDGVYGVLAGFEVLEALEDAGVSTAVPIEVVAWTNEEGCRFAPGAAGSSTFAGAVDLADLLAGEDSVGTRFGDALAETLTATPDAERRPLGFPVAAFVEAHIEQGPVLEAADRIIGVVTGIQGSRWFQVDVQGATAHAGTAPRRGRRDALMAALNMVEALRRLTEDDADTIRFTVGRMEVSPNSPNTVPARVRFTIDLRHPDATLLQQLGDEIAPVCAAHAGPCDVTVEITLSMPPTLFNGAVVDTVRAAAARCGLSHMDMPSGAFHDAKFLADICPAGMIFVPCKDGLSHNEAEFAKAEDLAAGTAVLAAVVQDLARR